MDAVDGPAMSGGRGSPLPGTLPLVISHAGCAGHAPENTLAGIARALALGAEAVEVDVRSTADGVPVLLHDATLDRTTDGRGPLRSWTLDRLRRLDAGSGERVPTLAEAAALAAGRALLVAEIKEPGIEGQVEASLAPLGPEDAQVWSFLPQVLASYGRIAPRRRRVLLVGAEAMARWPLPLLQAREVGAAGLGLPHEAVTLKVAAQVREAGLLLYAWTADDPSHLERLLLLGPDGVVSNYPERALRLRRQLLGR
ncbi:MAG TPA: glycerophosphodiester phosphodiesterase family protein [Dehalococcoidia bacterium]|nr:glycerophosphodiester phosphodiesterase family protein [Dehalococcoidia bacterium]